MVCTLVSGSGESEVQEFRMGSCIENTQAVGGKFSVVGQVGQEGAPTNWIASSVRVPRASFAGAWILSLSKRFAALQLVHFTTFFKSQAPLHSSTRTHHDVLVRFHDPEFSERKRKCCIPAATHQLTIAVITASTDCVSAITGELDMTHQYGQRERNINRKVT